MTAPIESEPHLAVCAAVAGDREGLDALAESEPDLVIADLSFGKGVLNVNATLSMSRTLPMGGSLTTLGRVLTQAGYRMAYKGKWHLDSFFADFSKLRRPSDHDEKMIVDDAFDHRMTIEDEASRHLRS